MNIKKVDDKPMVIHTKEKTKIHVKAQPETKIKGRNVLVVEKKPKIAGDEKEEQIKKDGNIQKGKASAKEDVRKSVQKEAGIYAQYQKSKADREKAIGKKTGTVKTAASVGAMTALEQMEGGNEIYDSYQIARTLSAPAVSAAEAGKRLYKTQAAKAKAERIKKVQAGRKIGKKTVKESASKSVKHAAKTAVKETANKAAKEAAKEVAKEGTKAATKAAVGAVTTTAGTAVSPGLGTAIGIAAGYAAGVSIEYKDMKATNRNRIVMEHGYVETTLDSGSNSKWNDEYYKYFGGKEILILPDNDEPGIKYAEMLKQRMPWAVIKKLPDLEISEDVYDWLQKGHSMDEIKDIEEYMSDDIEKDSRDKKTPSDILLELIERENIEIFLDDSNESYVAVFINGHREIHPISSNDFSLWLQMLYYMKLKKTIRNDNLSQAINILNFKARVNGGKRKKLNNRVARLENDFWYDMTDENYSAIKISIDGWSLEKIPPILFCRYGHQVPQVLPQHGGDIDKIFEYVNLVKFKKLFICWLVFCFVPNIPHPMTILYGEKGAAKSTACELIKRIIDPWQYIRR